MKTAEKKTTEKRKVEIWEARTKKAGHRFAWLKTNKAIYDRVAIVANLPTMITIQFPVGTSRNKNLKSAHTSSDNFTIKQENISKKDIERIRYYKA